MPSRSVPIIFNLGSFFSRVNRSSNAPRNSLFAFSSSRMRLLWVSSFRFISWMAAKATPLPSSVKMVLSSPNPKAA